jgi:ketosteroid isomerase-like protein
MFNRFCAFTNCSPLTVRKQQRHLLKLSLALALVVLAALSAAATEKTDVMTTVHKFVDSFNKGDVKTVAATCADQASIIDEFPPHEWHGAGACAKWMDDYDADAKKNGITDGIVTLGVPLHVDVTADRAYVVVPANYKFKKNGKLVRETGSTLTIALQKSEAGWRMTGWSWAKH